MKYTIEVVDEDNWVEQVWEEFNTDKTLKLYVGLIPKRLMELPSSFEKEHELGLVVVEETLMKGCLDSGKQHKIIITTDCDCKMFVSGGRYSFTLVFVKTEVADHKIIYENYRDGIASE